MDLNLPQTRPGLVRKIHFCEVAISRMLTFTQILHSGIFLILSHFYFPIYSISSFHIYKLSLGRIFTSAQFCQTWAVSSQSHLSLLLSLLSLSFFIVIFLYNPTSRKRRTCPASGVPGSPPCCQRLLSC